VARVVRFNIGHLAILPNIRVDLVSLQCGWRPSRAKKYRVFTIDDIWL